MKAKAAGIIGSLDGKLHEWYLSTPEEKDSICNLLFRPERKKHRSYVTFICPAENLTTSLQVAVSQDARYASVEWTDIEKDQILHSLNLNPFSDSPLMPWDPDGETLCWMRNSFIPVQDAERAMNEYLNSGQCPISVQWQTMGWEVEEITTSAKKDPETRKLYHLITDMKRDHKTGEWHPTTHEEQQQIIADQLALDEKLDAEADKPWDFEF